MPHVIDSRRLHSVTDIHLVECLITFVSVVSLYGNDIYPEIQVFAIDASLLLLSNFLFQLIQFL